MTKFLISFPSEAMIVSDDDLPQVADDARAVVHEAKDAGVYVFGGGINEDVAAVSVTGGGEVRAELYPQSKNLKGGFTVLELASRDDAVAWAAKIATACRYAQELREFQYDPMS